MLGRSLLCAVALVLVMLSIQTSFAQTFSATLFYGDRSGPNGIDLDSQMLTEGNDQFTISVVLTPSGIRLEVVGTSATAFEQHNIPFRSLTAGALDTLTLRTDIYFQVLNDNSTLLLTTDRAAIFKVGNFVFSSEDDNVTFDYEQLSPPPDDSRDQDEDAGEEEVDLVTAFLQTTVTLPWRSGIDLDRQNSKEEDFPRILEFADSDGGGDDDLHTTVWWSEASRSLEFQTPIGWHSALAQGAFNILDSRALDTLDFVTDVTFPLNPDKTIVLITDEGAHFKIGNVVADEEGMALSLQRLSQPPPTTASTSMTTRKRVARMTRGRTKTTTRMASIS